MESRNKKFLLQLIASIQPPYCSKDEVKKRNNQILEGLKKFFEYKEKLKIQNCDYHLLENTVLNYDNLSKDIQDFAHENNLKIIFSPHNIYGCKNKGAGEIENFKFAKEVISNYQWFIHFEPRQLLISHQFFDSFFENPRNLFTINKNPDAPRHFNTGLYATESKNIIKFIDQFSHSELQNMVSNSSSIEYIIYEFYVKNNIEFDTLDKMDLIWFDGEKQKHM